MPDIDLREFAAINREYFWKGTQNALTKLIIAKDESKEGIIYYLKMLLDMHKSILKGEKVNEEDIEPFSGKKKGPGWE